MSQARYWVGWVLDSHHGRWRQLCVARTPDHVRTLLLRRPEWCGYWQVQPGGRAPRPLWLLLLADGAPLHGVKDTLGS